jgi:hypothetical protein
LDAKLLKIFSMSIAWSNFTWEQYWENYLKQRTMLSSGHTWKQYRIHLEATVSPVSPTISATPQNCPLALTCKDSNNIAEKYSNWYALSLNSAAHACLKIHLVLRKMRSHTLVASCPHQLMELNLMQL